MSPVAITGASSGIGRRIAELAASRGEHVVALGRDEARLGALARELGARCTPVCADLTAPDRLDAVAAQLVSLGVTRFVHAAGQAEHAPLVEVDAERLRAHLELHVIAGFVLARAIAAGASEGSSSLFLSSTLAARPAKGTLAYAVAKGALDAMVRGLAVELAPAHRVNALVLGVVDTPMVRAPRGDGLSASERLGALAERHLLGTLVDVDDVASTALHVLGLRSMTGALVAVDGGLTLGP